MKNRKTKKPLSPRMGPWSLNKGTKTHKVKKGPGAYKRLKGEPLMKSIDENNKYRKYFKVLAEQELAMDAAEEAIAETDPASEQAALEAGLEPETDPEEFDIDPVDIGIQTNVVKKISEFIDRIDEFAKFLNDEEGDSVNKYINEIDKEGSVLKGISSETNKVTTVAENLASLAEAFKGKMLVALRKHREKQSAVEDY